MYICVRGHIFFPGVRIAQRCFSTDGSEDQEGFIGSQPQSRANRYYHIINVTAGNSTQPTLRYNEPLRRWFFDHKVKPSNE